MFEGTAPNRTAKQEPRTKIQQNKWHFFHAPQVKGFICGVHVLFLHFTTFAWFRRVNNLHLLLFYLQYPPTCLPCLLHPPGSNYICNFSIFSIPHLFACFTTHTGSEPACSCMCYFLISVPRRLFTWLQTSVCIDFAKKAQACKDMKQATKKRKTRSSIQPRSRA